MTGKRSKTVSREQYDKVRLQRDEYHSKWLTAAKELAALRACGCKPGKCFAAAEFGVKPCESREGSDA